MFEGKNMHAMFRSRGSRIMILLALASVLAIGQGGCRAAAGSFDAQYGSPTRPVSEVLGIKPSEGSGSQGSGELAFGGAGSGGSSAGGSVASTGNSASGAGSGNSTETRADTGALAGLLPDTGGTLLVFTALAGSALVVIGLVLLRRAASR